MKRRNMERKWELRLNKAKAEYQKTQHYHDREKLEEILDSLPRKSSIIVHMADGKFTLIKEKKGWHFNGDMNPVLIHNVLRNALANRKIELSLPPSEVSISRREALAYIMSAYDLPDDRGTRRIVDGILDYAYYHLEEEKRSKFIYDLLGNSIGLTTAEIKEMTIQ